MRQNYRTALQIFHRAAREIPAYRDFLKAHRMNAPVKTLADFKKLPIMDKQGYLYKYPMHKLFKGECIPPMVYASSGSSGKPTFWFRDDAQERIGAKVHERIFKDIFGISKNETTLVVICFSMGIWVAGNYTLESCREVARKGYRLSAVTPGTEMEDIMNVLKNLAPSFEHLILAGYPPFLMDVVTGALHKKIPLGNKVRFITAGDKFTEEWRMSILGLVHARDPLRSLISIYGSADAGVLGHETPASIFLRKEALRNKKLAHALFDDEPEPALVQYDPGSIFFEEEGGELLFTAPTATPLVRYNIHDTGKVFSFEEMRSVLKDLGLTRSALRADINRWQWPFLVKKGRNDVAVTFYALNIYPENIASGLEGRGVRQFVSGKFFAFNKNLNHNKKQKLYIKVELAQRVKTSQKLLHLIQQSIINQCIALNIEYRKLYSILGKNAVPDLVLVPFGTGNFHKKGVRGIMATAGKKTKIVN